MADFYEMDFMKDIVILVKVDEMYYILKFASHCLLVERWDGNGWSQFFCLRYAHTFTISLLLCIHLVRDTAAEKEVDIVI